MMEAMFDTTGFLSKKKATKVPNHLRGVHSRYADKTEIKKKLGNAKEKKRQDIDTLMIAKTDVGKIQCRHDAEK